MGLNIFGGDGMTWPAVDLLRTFRPAMDRKTKHFYADKSLRGSSMYFTGASSVTSYALFYYTFGCHIAAASTVASLNYERLLAVAT
jgi:hypothetical protein